MESLENQRQVSHPFHRPWKSLRDSHIPTASTTVPLYKTNTGRGPNRLAKGINHLGWAKLKCRNGPRVLAKSTTCSRFRWDLKIEHQANCSPPEKLQLDESASLCGIPYARTATRPFAWTAGRVACAPDTRCSISGAAAATVAVVTRALRPHIRHCRESRRSILETADLPAACTGTANRSDRHSSLYIAARCHSTATNSDGSLKRSEIGY